MLPTAPKPPGSPANRAGFSAILIPIPSKQLQTRACHSDFTSDYVIPKVLFLAAHGLTDWIGLTYNVGSSLVTSNDDGGRRTDVEHPL